MKRCLNCMEEYDDSHNRCPRCHYGEGDGRGPACALPEGSILGGRYIVGTLRTVRLWDMTYIGWDALFERKVLIQEFFPSEMIERDGETAVRVKMGREELYNESLDRFTGYHKSLIRLYKEEDVICVYSCFTANGTACAALQYGEADTLKEWMGRGCVERGESMGLLFQAAEALKKVHGLGLVHGAVDLESFWVTNSGRLVLQGFAGPGDCGQGRLDSGARVDVYGLALLSGRLLLNRPDGKPSDIVRELMKQNSGVPARTARAIRGVLTPNQEEEQGRTLDEFCFRMFGDGVTTRLLNRSQNYVRGPHRRLGAGRICAICLLALAVTAVGWCIRIKGGTGDVLSRRHRTDQGAESLFVTEASGSEARGRDGKPEEGESPSFGGGEAGSSRQPEQGSGEAAGQGEPGSTGAAGGSKPGSGEAAGQSKPGSGEVAGSSRANGAGADGQSKPGSGEAAGQSKPGSGEAAGQLKPGSGEAAGQPKPGGGETAGQPKPGGGETAGQPKPGSGETAGQPKPGSGETAGPSKPGSGEAAGQPKPGSGEAAGQPKPGSGEAAGPSKPGSGEAGQSKPGSAGAADPSEPGSTANAGPSSAPPAPPGNIVVFPEDGGAGLEDIGIITE